MNKRNIAEVIPFNMHLNRGFHYLIPPDLEKAAAVGKRVKIHFRNKNRTGVIVNITGKTDIAVQNLKEIEEIIDPYPVLTPEMMILIDWISRYYICPKGTIITHVMPSRISRKKIASLLEHDSGQRDVPDDIPGNIEIPDKIIRVHPQQSSLFNDVMLGKKSFSVKPILFHYHHWQYRDRFYMRWTKKFVRLGKQVLILIPDQWSCNELKKKMAQNFGNTLGVFDKKADQWQKYLRFLRVQGGSIKVVIGTRSSIFLPFTNLGLIILEQENSQLYKEERTPRYHAREIALARGGLGSGQVILGSFAPSVESYWHSMKQEYQLKTENQEKNRLIYYPRIEVINMQEEKSFQRIISFRLQQQIIQCLREKNKVVLFLNRRGIASYMACLQCGYVMRCPDCNHLLSFHQQDNAKWIICHVCGKRVKMDKCCPNCGEDTVKPMGFGTQLVELMVKRMFPKTVVQRFDIDIAPGKNLQKKITNAFNQGKIDILVGTQLMFREIHYQHIGVLGMIFADHLLNIPEYQSAELTFQFIYQLALNLALRNKSKTLLIQTSQPEHHVLQAIKCLDDSLFYREELMLRKELEYPPFTQMIRIDFLGKQKERVRKSALDFIHYARQAELSSGAEMDFQLNSENLIIVKENDKNRASCVLKINPGKQNIEHFKEKLFPYILKYKSNDVKLMIDVQQ